MKKQLKQGGSFESNMIEKCETVFREKNERGAAFRRGFLSV